MGAPARILVVDDEEDIRDLVSEILETAGHRVHTAASGALALDAFDPGRFDVMLCDLTMQGMSGWDVASAVRARDPRIRIALLTGLDITLPQERIQASGVDAVLGKPFQVDRMLHVVEDLVRRGGANGG